MLLEMGKWRKKSIFVNAKQNDIKRHYPAKGAHMLSRV